LPANQKLIERTTIERELQSSFQNNRTTKNRNPPHPTQQKTQKIHRNSILFQLPFIFHFQIPPTTFPTTLRTFRFCFVASPASPQLSCSFSCRRAWKSHRKSRKIREFEGLTTHRAAPASKFPLYSMKVIHLLMMVSKIGSASSFRIFAMIQASLKNFPSQS
jgi:hypothetical protein